MVENLSGIGAFIPTEIFAWEVLIEDDSCQRGKLLIRVGLDALKTTVLSRQESEPTIGRARKSKNDFGIEQVILNKVNNYNRDNWTAV